MTRDMTTREFEKACDRHGFRPSDMLAGYYDLGYATFVHAPNAGPRRRDQLAYLIREHEKLLAKQAD